MIIIVDYGVGNLGSILNMFKKIGVNARISSNIQDIEEAKKIILPGVGAFDNAMENLKNLGMIPILNKKVIKNKTPILGICLGMQLLTKGSEEGSLEGLGWIDAETVRFRLGDNRSLKIPHMGWNTIDIRKESCLYGDMYEEPRFYFVHSYYVKCNNPENSLTTTNHGIEFCSSVMEDNILGVQFHPEKSHKFGMKLLKNFAELC
ncbi:MAG: imidazole glycerol phosphate synthase, glutamine amidotransferase subunit [Candidatus Altiarchaeales archaeon WOR_SM1_79]|nr:MAG: imidazole glycerol phosphate synthase, glutamine amidotransferase subunit [Candidatus Altiarchaeales archaeon WOR_SM1_79]